MLCNAGTDTTNAYKQAVEFGLEQKQVMVAPLVFLSDVHSLGASTAHGLQFTTSWYWDQSDETRAWSKRYRAQTGTMPNDTHAALYSAVTSYLRGVQQAGTDDAQATVKVMKAAVVSDVFCKEGRIRQDGKMVFDRYLVQVKDPDRSRDEWDLLDVLGTIPAAEGFRPLSQSECVLVKR